MQRKAGGSRPLGGSSGSGGLDAPKINSKSNYPKWLLLLLPIAAVVRMFAMQHGELQQPAPVSAASAVIAETPRLLTTGQDPPRVQRTTVDSVLAEVRASFEETAPAPIRQRVSPASSEPPEEEAEAPVGAALPPPPSPPPTPEGCLTCAIAHHLQFNDHAVELFRRIDTALPPGHRGIMVSFSSLSMKEFMVNWARQVLIKGLGPVVIGALDEGAYKICNEEGIPAVAFGSLAMRTTTAYFRQDEGTFLAMATLKSELLRGLLESGWDVMLSDVDVAWMDSPWRWIGTNGVKPVPEAARMAKADVLVSSDVVEIEADSYHGRWLLDREYNTGILFFRATNASIGLVKLWRERLEIEGAIKGLYINDQAVFNRMTHGHADGRIDEVELLPHEMPDIDPRAIRGVYKIQSPIMLPHNLWVNMGVFPLTRFCNGHVFFINRLPERFGLRAAAVHATYQFADEKAYSFGKRHRLRQAQLWHMDEDSYYREGDYLAIRGDSLMVGAASIYSQDELPVWRGKNYRENSGIDLHMRMELMQRTLLRDAFALAHALGRILVLPHMTCFCDRYWWLIHACRMPGAESMPLPIECPLDHIFDMGRWYDENLAFREARFLENPKVPSAVAQERSRLVLQEAPGAPALGWDPAAAPEYDDGGEQARKVRLPRGLTLEEAAAAIAKDPAGGARVLEVDARDLGAFCGFGAKAAGSEFDGRVTRAFRNGVAICAEEDNILPLRDWDPVKLPLNCTYAYNPPEDLSKARCSRDHCAKQC